MTSLLPEQAEFRLPDFTQLDAQSYRAVIHAAMQAERDGLDKIATDTQPPTARNVIHAWEHAGLALSRACSAFFTRQDADTTPELDDLADELAPELAAHQDAIVMDRRLFDRLVALDLAYTQGEVQLDAQDAWWLHEQLREYRRSGVDLPDDKQERLRELNSQIAAAQSRFSQLVVAGRNQAAVHFSDEDEIAGLNQEQRNQAAQVAHDKGLDGWLLELVNTTSQDWLASLDNQESRRTVYLASIQRGTSSDSATGELILKLARLRAERAQLLGYENHAAYVADDGCAGTVEAITDLLGQFSQLAVHQAEQDAERYRAAFATLAPGQEFGPWDWPWVATKQRAIYAVDDDLLRPYLEFDAVMLQGVFAAAQALYGIELEARDDLSGYTADTTVYQVNESDGRPLGLLIVDPWARPSKQGGAWMTDLVDFNGMDAELPVVTLNTNVTRPQPGQPALLTWDQVITCFHEFGHCLHGLFAASRYPSMAGTNTPVDYVEFPSQVNEHWAWHPQLISRYARHWQTGEPIPAEFIDKLSQGRLADVGFEDLELVAAMQLDQVWHTTSLDDLPDDPADIDSFEEQALRQRGVYFDLVAPRYRSRYFSHIWGGGYAAAYYAYLWAEVYDADAVAWFTSNDSDGDGGLNQTAGRQFRDAILGVGGSVNVADNYRELRGDNPDVRHLMERHRRTQ